MILQLEVISASGTRRVSIDSERSTIGKSPENDLVLTDDETASRLHAVIERFPAGWLLTDLGSSNGTSVNGERLLTARRLHDGDEIRIGQIRLVVRSGGSLSGELTATELSPPDLTRREHDVLVALCRPLLGRDLFTEPASTRAIAHDLVITDAAVKQHLGNLYAKFDIPADESNRRMRLANAALRRGAVSLSDLRPHDS
ncbi:MAG: hypothetical protein JWO02_3217 [Solirubrobacterales bacterium]|nr:hypothetical protein [Solirubrobacterales bacterium]